VVPGARLVVLGKQGAGKGTQCLSLSHHYVVSHISTGDLLREEVKLGTPLGREAKALMENGDLLSDDLIIAMVRERLNAAEVKQRGFILDGFPRTVSQAEALADLLAPLDLDLVIDIEIDTAVVVRRLSKRRVCTGCGRNYSTTNRPTIGWTCDTCANEVVQRPDDQPEAITHRLEIYETQTAPLIEWYAERDLLVTVSGMGTEEAVTRRMVKAIEDRRNRKGGRFA
jgi:adenylate kinase